MEAPTETNSEMGEAEPSVPKTVIVEQYRGLHLATVMNSPLRLCRDRSPNCSSLDVLLKNSGITYRYSHPRREAGVELRRHTWDDPVEGFFAADTMGGWMFVIEFAFCGVCRKEGGAGAE